MTLLEGGILCVVLAAMWRTKEPARSAMSIVLYVAIFSIVLNMAYDMGWVTLHELSPLIGIFELIGALATLALSQSLRKSDRTFFYNMAKFFIASASLSFVAPLEVITVTTYMVTAYFIVAAHLVYMLRHSNGVMGIFRGVRGCLGGNDRVDSNRYQREGGRG